MFKGEAPLGVSDAAKVLDVPVSWIYSHVEAPACDLKSLQNAEVSEVERVRSCRRSLTRREAGRGRHDFASCGSVCAATERGCAI